MSKDKLKDTIYINLETRIHNLIDENMIFKSHLLADIDNTPDDNLYSQLSNLKEYITIILNQQNDHLDNMWKITEYKQLDSHKEHDFELYLYEIYISLLKDKSNIIKHSRNHIEHIDPHKISNIISLINNYEEQHNLKNEMKYCKNILKLKDMCDKITNIENIENNDKFIYAIIIILLLFTIFIYLNMK